MGVIAKQSIKGSILIYIAIVIGFINTGLIFPKVLNTEQIGLLNILISYVTIISQFGNLGFTSTIIKFFPYFKNKDKFHNGFLKLITIVSFLGFLISVGIFFIIKSFLIKTGTEKSILFFEKNILNNNSYMQFRSENKYKNLPFDVIKEVICEYLIIEKYTILKYLV